MIFLFNTSYLLDRVLIRLHAKIVFLLLVSLFTVASGVVRPGACDFDRPSPSLSLSSAGVAAAGEGCARSSCSVLLLLFGFLFE